MDPFDDLFGANTSGEGNSTIDDDFESLFGNITVPSSSDLDSLILEDDPDQSTTSDPNARWRSSPDTGGDVLGITSTALLNDASPYFPEDAAATDSEIDDVIASRPDDGGPEAVTSSDASVFQTTRENVLVEDGDPTADGPPPARDRGEEESCLMFSLDDVEVEDSEEKSTWKGTSSEVTEVTETAAAAAAQPQQSLIDFSQWEIPASALAGCEEECDASQPLDALSFVTGPVSQGEINLLADDQPSDPKDLGLGDLSSLPEVSAMEQVEPESRMEEKCLADSMEIVSAPNVDGEDSVGIENDKDSKKDAEKENKTEKEENENEKYEADVESEQLDAKETPSGDNFMDFSILELPGYAHLNLEINKHKRSLSKKGSISRRKRPTRAAIQGFDSQESLFQDSTEAKPEVPDVSGEEIETQRDASFGKGDQREDSSTPPPEKESSPPKKFAGGIKIPGLLEGLSKAKPFAKKSPKTPKEDTVKKESKDSEAMDTSTAADSPTPAPKPATPSSKSAVPPPTLLKPSGALSRMLPVPASSKILKDSQNKNIIEAESSVKPSALKGSSSSSSTPVQAKLPTLKRETPSPPKPSPSGKAPPPVVAKKPTVPLRSKTLPAKSTSSPTLEKDTNGSSVTSKNNESTLTTSATLASTKKESSTPPPKAKSSTQLPPKPKLKPIIGGSAKDETRKSTSTPTIFEKAKSGLTPVSKPLPGIDNGLEKSDTSEKTSEKKENIPLSPTGDNSVGLFTSESDQMNDTTPSSFKSSVIGDVFKDEGSRIELMPRKASISGIFSVSPPVVGGEKAAPRKNSITGSAYAPMGFRSTLLSTTSSDGDVKHRTDSITSTDGVSPLSLSRQNSHEAQPKDTAKSKVESTSNDKPEAPDVLRPKPQTTDLTSAKNAKLNSDTVLKESNPRDNGVDGPPAKNGITAKDNVDNSAAGKGEQQTPWGVQLRKMDKKVATSRPSAAITSTETDSPANWRQSLGQRRRSSVTPKEPVEKPQEPEKPEWAKALTERRKRLMNSGFIATNTK